MNNPTVRIHRLGYRYMHGTYVQQGNIVEQWNEKLQMWVFVSCCHPSDADQVASLYEKEKPISLSAQANH